MEESISIYICGSSFKEDIALRNELIKHLANLKPGTVSINHRDTITAGSDREAAIESCLNGADLIILLVSVDFFNESDCYEEMKMAMKRSEDGQARVISVLLRSIYWTDIPFSQLQMLPTNGLPITLWENRDEAFVNVVQSIWHPPPSSPSSVVCPYRNLQAFTENDTEFFFGRERYIESLVRRLKQDVRFLAVFGPSGSGKSSVVRAGLIPKIKQREVWASEHCDVLVAHPADDHFKLLSGSDLAAESQDLEESVQLWLAQASQQKRLVLVIDQFEELLRPQVVRRQELVKRLTQFLSSPSVTVILVMRDDFYNQFVEQSALREWLEHYGGAINIPQTLAVQEVTDIVQKPATVVGLRFEDGLVDIIVRDALETPSSLADEGTARSTILPLLECALTQLWEQPRTSERLSRDAYRAIGGVTGSLTRWADKIFFGLGGVDKQEKAHRIFTRLVHIDDERLRLPDSRRNMSLLSLCRNEQEQDEIDQIVRKLVKANLLVTTYDEQRKQGIVEIIHDALLQQWGLLREWLRKDRDFLIWHQELERRVRAWIQTNVTHPARREKEKLLRGSDLREAIQQQKLHPQDLSQVELDFIEASRRIWEWERRLRVTGVITAGLTLAGAGIWGVWPFFLSTIKPLFLAYVNVASSEYPTPIWYIAWSPNNIHIALAGKGGVQVWPATLDGAVYKYTGHAADVYTLAWSPDNYNIASGSADMTVQVWSSDGVIHPPNTYPSYIYKKHTDYVLTVAWSPDGKYIASGAASADPTVHVWRADHDGMGDLIYKYAKHQGPVNTVAWSSDSKYIASGSGDNTVQVWEARTGKNIFTYKGHSDHVVSVAWSPDDKYIASGGSDQTVQLWSASTGRKLRTYNGHRQQVNTLVWSQDGRYIASAGGDKTVQVWDALSGSLLCTYEEHHSKVSSITWSSSSTKEKLIASVGDDKIVHVWKLK